MKEEKLAICCNHLLKKSLVKVYEYFDGKDSTFMCEKCYKNDQLIKEIEKGNIDGWSTICECCVKSKFTKVIKI